MHKRHKFSLYFTKLPDYNWVEEIVLRFNSIPPFQSNVIVWIGEKCNELKRGDFNVEYQN